MDECIGLMVNSFFNIVDLFGPLLIVVPILAIGVLFYLGFSYIRYIMLDMQLRKLNGGERIQVYRHGKRVY